VSDAPVEPKPASSVVILRDSKNGPEILYLLRNPALAFHGGYWVFPGGRIDPADFPADAPTDQARAAKRAAVREAIEEADVTIDEATLEFAVHWTTPERNPIRFSTWFFVAPGNGNVTVDGGEIHDHRWMRPADALRAQRRDEIKLAAPTFALTTRLAPFTSVEAAMRGVSKWAAERLIGHIHDVAGGIVAVYPQDIAFEDGKLEQSGPHHRLWMIKWGWRYERAF
jgi:8-oxo-dGTP pyrophosphatase MutT (NUDIX family)